MGDNRVQLSLLTAEKLIINYFNEHFSQLNRSFHLTYKMIWLKRGLRETNFLGFRAAGIPRWAKTNRREHKDHPTCSEYQKHTKSLI